MVNSAPRRPLKGKMTDGSSNSLAPPARRRRKEARPAEIIEAGLAEFGAHGFEAARMEDVARRAGVAKGTVFRYFPTKEALFEAAITSRLTPVFDGIATAAQAHRGPAAPLLRGIVEGMYAQMVRPEVAALMRAIISEGPRFPAIIESYHRLSISRGQAALAGVVERAIATGEMRPGPLADLPMVMMAPALMAAIWGMTFAAVQPIPLERFRDAHVALVMAAFAAPARVPPT